MTSAKADPRRIAKPIPATEDGAPDAAEWALGPGSVSWTIFEDPTVFLVGLLREAMLLTLHPDFAAAAVDHDSFGDDPIMRFRRVAMYTYGATYGTTADAERFSAMVRRTHTRITGTEPMTDQAYRAHAEYELTLTQVMLVDSFRATYEAIYGELSGSKRDQFVREQKVPAALLGVDPAHMPDTFGESVDFLAHARVKFNAGLQARDILEPFSRGTYPRGTVFGDMPFYYKTPAMFSIRAMADMAMSTMTAEERRLISIDRRPKLGSATAVRVSLKALSAF
uniref:oxygenase MpaB family protein n=1 Tax=Aldersonia kunmingensis TaxID=408066 RepID=UPI0008317F85